MTAPSHCEVRLTRRYDATPTEVWAALTEPGSIGRWLAPVIELDLAPGGALELRNGVDARVRAVEPERVLELDWRYGDEDPSVVRFELAADGAGTILSLDHRRVDERFGMRYMSRWTGALDRFGRAIAGTA